MIRNNHRANARRRVLCVLIGLCVLHLDVVAVAETNTVADDLQRLLQETRRVSVDVQRTEGKWGVTELWVRSPVYSDQAIQRAVACQPSRSLTMSLGDKVTLGFSHLGQLRQAESLTLTISKKGRLKELAIPKGVATLRLVLLSEEPLPSVVEALKQLTNPPKACELAVVISGDESLRSAMKAMASLKAEIHLSVRNIKQWEPLRSNQSIHSLRVTDGALTKGDFDVLASMGNLASLELGGRGLDVANLSRLAKAPALRKLYFSIYGCPISPSRIVMADLHGLKHLRELEIQAFSSPQPLQVLFPETLVHLSVPLDVLTYSLSYQKQIMSTMKTLKMPCISIYARRDDQDGLTNWPSRMNAPELAKYLPKLTSIELPKLWSLRRYAKNPIGSARSISLAPAHRPSRMDLRQDLPRLTAESLRFPDASRYSDKDIRWILSSRGLKHLALGGVSPKRLCATINTPSSLETLELSFLWSSRYEKGILKSLTPIWGNLGELRTLSLRNVIVSDAGLSELVAALPKLERIEFGGVVQGLSPSGLHVLMTRSKSLRSIHIGRLMLTGDRK